MDLLNQAIPLWVLVAWAVFMAFVQAVPRPTETSGLAYTIFYQFLHGMSVNVKLLFDPRKKPAALPTDRAGG